MAERHARRTLDMLMKQIAASRAAQAAAGNIVPPVATDEYGGLVRGGVVPTEFPIGTNQ